MNKFFIKISFFKNFITYFLFEVFKFSFFFNLYYKKNFAIKKDYSL